MLGTLVVDTLSLITCIVVAIIGLQSGVNMASALGVGFGAAHLSLLAIWTPITNGKNIKLARDLIATAVSFNPHNPHFHVSEQPSRSQ